MKRIALFTAVAMVFVFVMGVSLYAQEYREQSGETQNYIEVDEINYQKTPINKLGRGVMNTATCWAEVGGGIMKESREQDPVVGATLGTVEGVVTGVIRGFTGLFEAVTFVIPPYDKPLMKPEYALTSADDQFRKYLW